MRERYVREVYRDDTHFTESSDGDGSHRSLEYDDDNNLVTHAKYFEEDEREIYEKLREKYGNDGNDHEIDVAAIQQAMEIGAILAPIVITVTPYIKDWFVDTAVPGIKAFARGVKERVRSRRSEKEPEEEIEVTFEVKPESSLALANQIEKAEQEYRKNMTSQEAREKLIAIFLTTAKLSQEINNLANAEIKDEAEALMRKTGWENVTGALSKDSLIEGVNNILELPEALSDEQLVQLQKLLGRELYQFGNYEPVSKEEIQTLLEKHDDDWQDKRETKNGEQDGDEL